MPFRLTAEVLAQIGCPNPTTFEREVIEHTYNCALEYEEDDDIGSDVSDNERFNTFAEWAFNSEEKDFYKALVSPEWDFNVNDITTRELLNLLAMGKEFYEDFGVELKIDDEQQLLNQLAYAVSTSYLKEELTRLFMMIMKYREDLESDEELESDDDTVIMF